MMCSALNVLSHVKDKKNKYSSDFALNEYLDILISKIKLLMIWNLVLLPSTSNIFSNAKKL